jgi:hypothetical protein
MMLVGCFFAGSLGYGDRLWLGGEPTEHPIVVCGLTMSCLNIGYSFMLLIGCFLAGLLEYGDRLWLGDVCVLSCLNLLFVKLLFVKLLFVMLLCRLSGLRGQAVAR